MKQGCGNGNLKAAFMTGLERNGDVVAMSSYAPLFANPAWKRRHPDAVFFNAARAYGTPSHHAQTMFAANRADTCLPLKISGGAPGPVPALFAVAGRRRATGELILKVVNPAPDPCPRRSTCAAAGWWRAVMAAANDADENSFTEPAKVVPRDEPVTDAASSFRHDFRANSITILRLQIRG